MENPLVGAAAPYGQQNVNSIRTGRGGVWGYSPVFQGPLVLAQDNIVLTGRRAHDYIVAEADTGAYHNPRVTVWHHVYDYDPRIRRCTLQLVNWGDHQATGPHAGGCSQFAEDQNEPCQVRPRGPAELQKTLETFYAMEPPIAPLCSARKLEEFALKTGRRVCRALRELYGGRRAISRQGWAVLAAAEDLCLDAALPLTDAAGSAYVTAAMARLGRAGMTSPPDATALPFAIDPFGNEFWAGEDGQIYFYDHETDRYQAAARGLGSIID